jgi:hypothetical protein
MTAPSRRTIVRPYVPPLNDRRTASIVPWELILDRRLHLTTKGVAGLIGGYMNERGECRPSQADLAEVGGVSVPTIKRAIAQLVRCGWLEVELQSRGPVKRASIYRWRHPEHGSMKRVKAPQQVSATLLTLSRPRKAERGSPMIPARITDDPSAGITGDLPTTSKFSNEEGRKRERKSGQPELIGTACDWRAILAPSRPDHVLPDDQLRIEL